jgi:hypothetical protein
VAKVSCGKNHGIDHLRTNRLLEFSSISVMDPPPISPSQTLEAHTRANKKLQKKKNRYDIILSP